MTSPSYYAAGVLTAATARSVAAALLPYLGTASFVLDPGIGNGTAVAPLVAAGMPVLGVDPDRSLLAPQALIRTVCATVLRLPFAAASVPAVHFTEGFRVEDDWRGACAEIGRVLMPGGVLAAVIEPFGQDPLPEQVRRHFLTQLAMRSSFHAGPEPIGLQRAAQVDAELVAAGCGAPTLVRIRGQQVTSARRLVAAARARHSAVAALVADVDLDELGEQTVEWAARRTGGPDVEVLLAAGRAYRIYRKCAPPAPLA